MVVKPFRKVEDQEYIIELDAQGIERLSIGKETDLYLNVFGKVVYVDIGAEKKFDYAYPIVTSRGQSLMDKAQVKLLLMNGEIKIFDISSKAMLNGRSVLADGVTSVTTEYLCKLLNFEVETPAGETGPFLITYELNGEGEIKAIGTASSPSGDYYTDPASWFEDRDKFRLSYVVPEGGSPHRAIYGMIYPNGASTGHKGTAGSTFFVVPQKGNPNYDERNMEATDRGYFSSGTDYRNFKMYDIDLSNNAAAILVTADSVGGRTITSAEYENATLVCVEKKTKILDEDGEIQTMLHGFSSGTSQTFIFDKDITDKNTTLNVALEDYEPGDILLAFKNSKGIVDAYRTIFRPNVSEPGILATGGSGFAPTMSFETVYGRCVYNQNNMLAVNLGSFIHPFNSGAAGKHVYLIDLSENRSGRSPVSVATFSEIRAGNPETGIEGDEVVIHANRNSLRTAVIIRR